jgi:hypothetical protein
MSNLKTLSRIDRKTLETFEGLEPLIWDILAGASVLDDLISRVDGCETDLSRTAYWTSDQLKKLTGKLTDDYVEISDAIFVQNGGFRSIT